MLDRIDTAPKDGKLSRRELLTFYAEPGDRDTYRRLLDTDNDGLRARAAHVRRDLKTENGFSRTAPPRDERRAPRGQPAGGQDVEARDARPDLFHHAHRSGSTPQDTRRSMSAAVFDKSPITYARGSGRFFMRTGVKQMPSDSARSGCRLMSQTSKRTRR